MKTIIHYKLHEVVPYIHWGYFFHAWNLPFAYESIAATHDCPACRNRWVKQFPAKQIQQAKEAIALYEEALVVLREMDVTIQSHALIGLYKANSQGNDIYVWDDEERKHTIPMLRQQHGTSCLCISDYITPITNSKPDKIGIFAASVDEAMETAYPNDPYRHMLCQTLADRLAEATIELTHETVRKKIWGYASEEQLNITQLLAEKFQGRRPAVGYPSLPDQSINFLLNDILDFSLAGIRLTENGAMIPHASTSGLMLSHPDIHHFAVGRIGEDQLNDYAKRRGFTTKKMKQFLAANL